MQVRASKASSYPRILLILFAKTLSDRMNEKVEPESISESSAIEHYFDSKQAGANTIKQLEDIVTTRKDLLYLTTQVEKLVKYNIADPSAELQLNFQQLDQDFKQLLVFAKQLDKEIPEKVLVLLQEELEGKKPEQQDYDELSEQVSQAKDIGIGTVEKHLDKAKKLIEHCQLYLETKTTTEDTAEFARPAIGR